MKRKILLFAISIGIICCGMLILIYNIQTKIVDLSSISSGDTQVIAILDSGIDDALLAEYGNKIMYTYNVIDKNESVEDEIGHGTALVSLLLGSENMNLKGLLPNVKVIVIKITDQEGKSNFEYLIKGLEIAEAHQASIINISLGGDISNIEVTKKINDLYNKNITVVAASGDYGDKDILYPANLSTVVSVSSINDQYNLSNFSNYDENNICAFPGENLNMLSINDGVLEKTTELNGTSYAAIYACAYVAAIRDYAVCHNMNLSNKGLFSILKESDPLKNKKIVTEVSKIFN